MNIYRPKYEARNGTAVLFVHGIASGANSNEREQTQIIAQRRKSMSNSAKYHGIVRYSMPKAYNSTVNICRRRALAVIYYLPA